MILVIGSVAVNPLIVQRQTIDTFSSLPCARALCAVCGLCADLYCVETRRDLAEVGCGTLRTALSPRRNSFSIELFLRTKFWYGLARSSSPSSEVAVGVGPLGLFRSTQRTVLTSRTVVGADVQSLLVVQPRLLHRSLRIDAFSKPEPPELDPRCSRRCGTFLPRPWTRGANIMAREASTKKLSWITSKYHSNTCWSDISRLSRKSFLWRLPEP